MAQEPDPPSPPPAENTDQAQNVEDSETGTTTSDNDETPPPESDNVIEDADQEDSPEPGTEELPETVVTEQAPEEQKDYRAKTNTTGTKVERFSLTTPQTVNVITRDLLEDQGATTIEDVWRNVPGAHTSFGEGGGGSMTMRGFSVSSGAGGSGFGYPLFFNGLRGQPYGGYNSPRLYNVERIEVLKGPAAVLYGSGAPGGMINIISRKPQPFYQHRIDFTLGSFDRYSSHLHSTGPLSEEKDLMYLVDIGFDDANSFRDHVETQNFQLTTALTWLVSDDTQIDFEFGVIEDHRKGQPDRGIPAVDGELFVLPNSYNPQEPSDYTDISAYYGELHLKHQLSDSLALNAGVRAFSNEHQYDMHFPGSIVGVVQSRTFSRGNYQSTGVSSDINLLWTIENELVVNQLLLGFDFSLECSESLSKRATQGVPGLLINRPRYYASPDSYSFSTISGTDAEEFRYGVYLQDHVELWDRLHLMAGVRYDAYDVEQTYSSFTTPDYLDDGGALTFKAGVLYELLDNLSVYGSFGQSYEPQSPPRNPQPTTFDPLEGWQVETGIKGSWLEDRLTTTAAFFYINQQNVLVSDPIDNTLLIMIGEEESMGVEVEVVGQLTDNWSVLANYTYTDARVTDDSDPDRIGQSLDNVARNQASVWTRYEFEDTGLAVFGGLNYVDKRPPYHGFTRFGADYYPEYTTVDVGLSYKYKNMTLRANLNNVLDEDIALGGRGGYGYMPGTPRNFSITLSFDL